MPAFRGAARQDAYTSGSSAVDQPSATQVGDLLIWHVLVRGDGVTHVSSVNTPAGWTLLRSATLDAADGPGVRRHLRVFTKTATVAGTTSHSVTWTGPVFAYVSHTMAAFSDPRASNPVGTETLNTSDTNSTGTSRTMPAPAASPSTPDGLVYRVWGVGGDAQDASSDSFSAPGGHTSIGSTGLGATGLDQKLGHAYFARSGTGSVAAASATIALRSVSTTYYNDFGHTIVLAEQNNPPTAPTLISPVGGVTVNRALPIPLKAQHNDPDGDAQSVSDRRYKVVGAGSWTTVSNATLTEDTYSIPAGLAAGDYEWQAQTYDSLGEASGWSASGFFTAGDVPSPPTITSHSTDDVVSSSTDTVTISASSLDEVAFRRVADDGSGNPDTGTVLENSGWLAEPSRRDYEFTGIADSTTQHYQSRLKSSGLTSDWENVRVVTSYTAPPEPTVTVTAVQADGRILVQIANPAPSGSEPELAHNDIYRRVTSDGGDGIRVAAGLAEDAAWNDWAVASGEDYEYLVRAVGDNATSTDSEWTGGTSGDPGIYGGGDGGY